jgi:uncharacterized protein YjiS (DUF1127 family)
MSHTSTSFAAAHAAEHSAIGRVLSLLTAAFAWIGEQRRVNRTIAALSELSDRTLADIGIDRSEIARVARYGRAGTGA